MWVVIGSGCLQFRGLGLEWERLGLESGVLMAVV